MVQFAGVEVEDGDTVHAVYTTPNDYMDEDPTVEADVTVERITGGGMLPQTITTEDKSQFAVHEDRVNEIEVL